MMRTASSRPGWKRREFLLSATGSCALPATLASQALGGAVAFLNGRWFNGEGFVAGDFCAVNGFLTTQRPPKVDAETDLSGRFVVPPFGEAHNHNLESVWDVDEVIRAYVEAGVFYVKIPNNIFELLEDARGRLQRSGVIDAAFANAGLTGPGGHPAPLYRHLLRSHRYQRHLGDLPAQWFDGRAFHIVSSMSDVRSLWPRILAMKPDFLKIYLAYSEFHGQAGECRAHGRSALPPELAAPIVRLVHSEGLSVAAHVETAADFRTALEAGVDEITHLPGWFLIASSDADRATLTSRDAERAAEQGAGIVTTTTAARRMEHLREMSALCPDAVSEDQTDVAAAEKRVQLHNLRLLTQANARLLIGSDHEATSAPEAQNLLSTGLFSNLEILKMWCEATPRAIFPDRKIGRLEQGYEANFLVLDGDPVRDFGSTSRIVMRVKNGRML